MENQNYTGPEPMSDKKENEQDVVKEEKSILEKDAEQQEEEDDCNSKHDDKCEKEEEKMALSEDPTKVKFTNSLNYELNNEGNKNGEAKVDIENVQLAFAGMGKEELLRYAEDPFWIKLRWSLFILFWVAWAAMLVGAIAIVVTTPGCPPLPARDWWQKGVIYQIYPRSFKDSNGDGVGDLPGITSKLGYLAELGINMLWLNPIYPSPMQDGGYDISDFTNIAPEFGTLEDFKQLIAAAKERDMHVIMDLVPNHSSDQHPWFNNSRERQGNYSDYYVWRDGVGPSRTLPPNNWKSVFGGSAWKYDDVRKQFYLHQFLESQPDLNLRNEVVQEEMKNVIRFWLDLGVSGFRVDAAKHIFEDEEFKDEPAANITALEKPPVNPPRDYDELEHIYTTSLPEVLDILQQWRDVLSEYEEKDGVHRFMTVEVYDPLKNIMQYYGNDTVTLADFPFNFELLNLKGEVTARKVYGLISSWLAAMPAGKWPNWVLGNHDISRVATRIHEDLVDAFNMIIHLLGGTPVTYYGEEIGMVDVPVPFSLAKDLQSMKEGEAKYRSLSRDFQRTPMQWNNESLAGFTNGSGSWLPVSQLYSSLNVELQEGQEDSHLNIYKKLVKLRKEPAIIYGDLHFPVITDDVFSFSRVKKGSPGYVVLINFGHNTTTVTLKGVSCCPNMYEFPEFGIVELKSSNMSPSSPLVASTSRGKFSMADIPLGPREAVIFNFVPNYPSA